MSSSRRRLLLVWTAQLLGTLPLAPKFLHRCPASANSEGLCWFVFRNLGEVSVPLSVKSVQVQSVHTRQPPSQNAFFVPAVFFFFIRCQAGNLGCLDCPINVRHASDSGEAQGFRVFTSCTKNTLQLHTHEEICSQPETCTNSLCRRRNCSLDQCKNSEIFESMLPLMTHENLPLRIPNLETGRFLPP